MGNDDRIAELSNRVQALAERVALIESGRTGTIKPAKLSHIIVDAKLQAKRAYEMAERTAALARKLDLGLQALKRGDARAPAFVDPSHLTTILETEADAANAVQDAKEARIDADGYAGKSASCARCGGTGERAGAKDPRTGPHPCGYCNGSGKAKIVGLEGFLGPDPTTDAMAVIVAERDKLRADLDNVRASLDVKRRQHAEAMRTRDQLDDVIARQAKALGAPVPMRLVCPSCTTLHLDVGEFATKPHHTHACQECGEVWRPAIVATVGVQFLPGFKNA